MIDPREFIECLESNAVNFFSGVPDSLLKDFCACLEHVSRPGQHIISANEGGAVALALGYHLATRKIPLVYLQNSGLGNIINPLLSLVDTEVYSIRFWPPNSIRDFHGIKHGKHHPPLLLVLRLIMHSRLPSPSDNQ